MPQRFLRPGITHSERWNSVDWACQSLFVRILTLVDDFGRFDGRASVIHGHCYAVWNDKQVAAKRCNLQQVAQMLQQLAASGLITIYDDPTSGKVVLQVEQWQERIRQGCVEKWPGKPNGAAKRSNLQQFAAKRSNLQPPTPSSSPTPSPAPAPTRAQEPSADLIESAEEAKREICVKILKQDPSIHWSYEAIENLARRLPLARGEIDDIDIWRSIPKDEDVPELKFRRETITETALMKYWGDELHRARAYLQKINGRSEKKKEPEQWRELFRWLSDSPDALHLPASFWGLGRDQQQEYHQNITAFQASLKPQPAEVVA